MQLFYIWMDSFMSADIQLRRNIFTFVLLIYSALFLLFVGEINFYAMAWSKSNIYGHLS